MHFDSAPQQSVLQDFTSVPLDTIYSWKYLFPFKSLGTLSCEFVSCPVTAFSMFAVDFCNLLKLFGILQTLNTLHYCVK